MIDYEGGRRFLDEHRDSRVVIIPHPDADGLAGTALLHRALTGDVTVMPPGKGEALHDLAFQARLADARPTALILIDQGTHAWSLLPGVPTLTIDHHRPEGIPEGVVVNSHQQPLADTCSQLCHTLLGAPPETLWLAAIGVLGDYGHLAPAVVMREAAARYGLGTLVDIVAYINAARRGSGYHWPLALQMLLTTDDPSTIIRGGTPEYAQLRADREEVNREFRRARRAQPHFADPWALIIFNSPCLIHALLATTWIRRLPAHQVVAANIGYRPAFVHFSARTELPVDLAQVVQALAPNGFQDEWLHGQYHAIGGSVTYQDFLTLTHRMGFRTEHLTILEQLTRAS